MAQLDFPTSFPVRTEWDDDGNNVVNDDEWWRDERKEKPWKPRVGFECDVM